MVLWIFVPLAVLELLRIVRRLSPERQHSVGSGPVRR